MKTKLVWKRGRLTDRHCKVERSAAFTSGGSGFSRACAATVPGKVDLSDVPRRFRRGSRATLYRIRCTRAELHGGVHVMRIGNVVYARWGSMYDAPQARTNCCSNLYCRECQ